MTRKKTQAYTEEFRREAVKRSEQPGVTQAQVAKELGISSQQIANWKRQFTRLSDKQFNSLDGVDYSKKESEEVRRLKVSVHTKTSFYSSQPPGKVLLKHSLRRHQCPLTVIFTELNKIGCRSFGTTKIVV